jgi:hypothetical protein
MVLGHGPTRAGDLPDDRARWAAAEAAGAAEGPGAGRAGRAGPGHLEEKPADGRIRPGGLDECGFRPGQPPTPTWTRRGERERMPDEDPERRRLNVPALRAQRRDASALHRMTTRHRFGAVALLHFPREWPPAPVPTVIVLDNVGRRRSQAIRAASAEPRQRRIHLDSRPPASPELNDSERLFRTIDHHELPARRYATFDALDAAVVAACKRQGAKRLAKPSTQPTKAA